jgi:hypothetical protein
MHAEKRLEGVQVALLKLAQDAARFVPHSRFPFYLCLRARTKKGYIQKALMLRRRCEFFYKKQNCEISKTRDCHGILWTPTHRTENVRWMGHGLIPRGSATLVDD